MRFKFAKGLGGSHEEGGKLYHRDEVITTDRPLDKLFKNRFERLQDEEPTPPAKKKTKAAAAEVEEEEEESTEEERDLNSIESELGENVTEDFPKASAAGVIVLKGKDKLYHVADPDTPNECDGEYANKKDLNAYLASLLSE